MPDLEFVLAVHATGRRELIRCAVWTEICMAFPALDALREGYEVYPVIDAIGGTSPEAYRAGVDQVIQADAQPVSWVSLAGDLQRDWARQDTIAAFAEIDRGGHGSARGVPEHLVADRSRREPDPAGGGHRAAAAAVRRAAGSAGDADGRGRLPCDRRPLQPASTWPGWSSRWTRSSPRSGSAGPMPAWAGWTGGVAAPWPAGGHAPGGIRTRRLGSRRQLAGPSAGSPITTRGLNDMPDAKELLHSNLHKVICERDLNADGRPSSEHIRKT